MSQSVDFHLRIQRLFNRSLVAVLTGPNNMSATALIPGSGDTASSMTSKTDSHDSQSPIGALYYVIAVVLIYGFSIILMIGSQIRKNKHDKGVSRCPHFSLSAFPNLHGERYQPRYFIIGLVLREIRFSCFDFCCVGNYLVLRSLLQT